MRPLVRSSALLLLALLLPCLLVLRGADAQAAPASSSSSPPSSSSSFSSPSSTVLLRRGRESQASPAPSSSGPFSPNASSPTPGAIIPVVHPDFLDGPAIFAVLATSSSLSVAGSLFIILSWILFTDMHFFSRKLIVYISATDLFSSAAFLYAAVRKTGVMSNTGGHASLECTVQGFALQFFVLASYMWTGCFAYHLHSLIANRRKKAHRLEVFYHAVSWGLPMLITIVLVVERLSLQSDIIGGADRPWCWLTNHASQHESLEMEMIQQFALFYVPAVVVFCYNVMIYIKLAGIVHGTELGSNIRKRVLLYLLVFLLCSVWGLAHRLYQAFTPGHQPLKWLSYAEAAIGPLQGFLNAIVYGISAKVVARYKRLCGCASKEDAERLSRGLVRENSAGSHGGYPRAAHQPSTGQQAGGGGSAGGRGYPQAVARYQPPTAVVPPAAHGERRALNGSGSAMSIPGAGVGGSRNSIGAGGGSRGAGGPDENNDPGFAAKQPSYSDESVFTTHRSSTGMVLGRQRPAPRT
jgi:hypothetical protein